MQRHQQGPRQRLPLSRLQIHLPVTLMSLCLCVYVGVSCWVALSIGVIRVVIEWVIMTWISNYNDFDLILYHFQRQPIDGMKSHLPLRLD